jgi:hypothetical protein
MVTPTEDEFWALYQAFTCGERIPQYDRFRARVIAHGLATMTEDVHDRLADPGARAGGTRPDAAPTGDGPRSVRVCDLRRRPARRAGGRD